MPRNSEKPQLIHFCVLYGDSKHLLKFFESYAKQDFDFTTWKVKLVLINNNSEKSAKPADFKFPQGIEYEVLTPGKNLGYFGAAQMALQQFPHSQWTIVSNTDLEFATPNFFSVLKDFKSTPDVGVVAPEIISDLTGRDQNPYMKERPSARKMRFLKYMFSTDLSSVIYQRLSASKKTFRTPTKKAAARHAQAIYAPHGSFLLFHQNYFVKGLDFEHPPFLFGEEITVAENLKAARLIALYDPALKIRHQEHQATGRIPDKRMRGFIKAASHYIADRYF